MPTNGIYIHSCQHRPSYSSKGHAATRAEGRVCSLQHNYSDCNLLISLVVFFWGLVLCFRRAAGWKFLFPGWFLLFFILNIRSQVANARAPRPIEGFLIFLQRSMQDADQPFVITRGRVFVFKMRDRSFHERNLAHLGVIKLCTFVLY